MDTDEQQQEPSSSKKRKNYSKCVVYDCPNNNINSPQLKFYRFPSASIFYPEKMKQRQIWIDSVKLGNPDGSAWSPTGKSRICSAHFIGNERSLDYQSCSYNPTIFPAAYHKKRVNPDVALGRYKRKLARETKRIIGVSQPVKEKKPKLRPKKDQETQVDFLEDENLKQDLFVCGRYISDTKCEAETQANRPLKDDKIKRKIIVKNIPESAETQTEPNANLSDGELKGFHGLNNINDEEEMRDLCGVSISAFHLLLKILKQHSANKSEKFKVNDENRLLIFLMRMKSALNFSALSVLFQVPKNTVKNIFYHTLGCLSLACKNFVFWPSNKVVQQTTPSSFKPEFAKCRVIVDSTEFVVQKPSTASLQQQFYSRHRKGYRIKNVIGCNPCGLISFVSKCHGGRFTDSQITVVSGLLDLLETDDVILADEGFSQIRNALDKKNKNIKLFTPTILENESFLEQEIQLPYIIGERKIYVERIMQRIKNYKIVDRFTIDMLSHCDNIIFMCCVLVNLQSKIWIKE